MIIIGREVNSCAHKLNKKQSSSLSYVDLSFYFETQSTLSEDWRRIAQTCKTKEMLPDRKPSKNVKVSYWEKQVTDMSEANAAMPIIQRSIALSL